LAFKEAIERKGLAIRNWQQPAKVRSSDFSVTAKVME